MMDKEKILDWVKQQSFGKFAEEYIVNVDELEKFLTAQEDENSELNSEASCDVILPSGRKLSDVEPPEQILTAIDEKEIAKRLYEEYEQWLSEWDGDYPNVREHATFEDWLDKEE